MESLQFWTDGGTENNGSADCLASWAFVCSDGTEQSGIDTKSSNNRAEMLGVIMALRYAKQKCVQKVVIHSDSQLVINCATGRWKRKANKDYWQLYNGAANGLQIEFKWVKGHNGDVGNERADELCGIELFKSEMQTA